MDPASLTIGIIGLSTVLLTTVRKLRETVQDVRYAQGDLSDVHEEIDLFAGTCDDFLDVCDGDPSISERTQKLKLQLISWTTRTVQGFDSLLDKVQAVARNPEDDYSAIEVLIAHVVWLRSKGTLKYLRASLSVARQNMICFTNTRIIEKLNVDLAHLKSVLSSTKTEKRRVEMLYDMTVEERIAITQHKIRKRHAQRSKIKAVLKEAIKEVAIHEKNIKDPDFAPQTKPLLQFRNTVSQYVNDVVFQEKIDRRARRSDQGSSFITSQSTATTPAQSTQSSHHQASAPESPSTSPEPHNSPQRYVPSEWGSHIDLPIPPVIIPPHFKPFKPLKPVQPLKPINNGTKGRACSCPNRQQTRRSSKTPSSPLNPRREMDKNNPTEPSTQPVREDSAGTNAQPVIHEENEENSQDETSEEGDPTNEQARKAGPSIWQATGAFEGDMPRGLSIRRQRSQSPQDFW